MQKVIKINEFKSFKNYLNEVMKKVNEVKDEINEDVKIKYNLEKYNQILEGSDSDLLTQYETWYDQLAKIVVNKNNAIQRSNEAIKQFEEFIELTRKEEKNNDEIKYTLNLLTEKMIDKETIIFNKNEKEIKKNQLEEEEKRKHKFNEKIKEINGLKYQYDSIKKPIKELFQNDIKILKIKEIEELMPSLYKLNEWSGKQNCSVLFDSDLDGDGGNNVLMNKILNKKNLCFIHFDNQNNVFGGYIDTIINETGKWIDDPNSFTFSFIRNGELRNIKYSNSYNKSGSFYLKDNSDELYSIGNGSINVGKIGTLTSYLSIAGLSYNEYRPFAFYLDETKFEMKKVMILKMK